MIICPNLNNKEVAQQFQELVDVVGEVAAYDIWSKNEGNAIDRAPNGAPSKLFTDLLNHFNGDRVLAIQAKAKTFSKGFKMDDTAMLEDSFDDIQEVTSNVTATDPTMRDRLFNGKSTATVSKVLDNIFATNSGLQDLVTTIKDSLNEEISNINIEVKTRTDSDRRATAYFDANTNTITVYDNARFKWADGLSDRTILHEIIHAFTTRELKINDAVRIEAETLLSEVRAQLEIKYGKDYETLIKERPIEFYGIKNVNEFLSEIFMNSYFVEELTTLSSKTKYSTVGSNSIYKKVINWIAKLIGLNKDAYTEGYRLLEKIMHEHQGYTRLNTSDSI